MLDQTGTAPTPSQSATTTPTPKLLYIVGAGHSGSTLLSLLLNAHPQITSLGELHRLQYDARTNTHPCMCGEAVTECEFWTGAEEEVRRMLGWGPRTRPLLSLATTLDKRSGNRFAYLVQKLAAAQPSPAVARSMLNGLNRRHASAAHNSLLWCEAVRRATGTPVVTDTTKNPRRLKMLHVVDPDAVVAIHLVRDGRAVVASEMRRTGCSVECAAKSWVKRERRSRAACATIPAHRTTIVYYEALCEDTGNTIDAITLLLGLQPDSKTHRLSRDHAHMIGGNPMRTRDRETSIVLDCRWRQELTRDSLAAFDPLAGAVNRRLGYT